MNSKTITRRDVLRGAAAAAACLLAGTGRTSGAASALARRQPRGLKLSCSSLAFSDMTWDKALEEIKKLGFRYADLAMFEGWTHISPSELSDPRGHAKKISSACNHLEVEPIALHANFKPEKTGNFPGLTTPDRDARKTVLSHFQRVVDCARAAEIPLINVQPGRFIPGTARETCLQNAVETLKAMQEAASRAGLILTFENHTGSIGQDPQDTLALLEGVPGLKLDYDPSHVVACSIPVKDTLPLMKYVAHVGIRNTKAGDYNQPIAGGKLLYPLKEFVDAFRTAKIDSYVSIEYFQPAMREQIPRLKEILEREGIPAQ